MASSSSSSSSTFKQIIKRDPTGQYVMYNEVIGRGQYKEVYKGFDSVNGTEIAWCVIFLQNTFGLSGIDLTYVCTENILLKRMDHENIVKCHTSWIDYRERSIYIITELFTSLSLRRYIKNHTLVDFKVVKSWCIQILKGLDYLHSRGIVHRDIKLDNIFISGNSGTVKIGDFGVAVYLKPGEFAGGIVGTPQYMAPELYHGLYNQLADIHSFGMCVLQMITRVFNLYLDQSIYRHSVYYLVKTGVKPTALNTVTDPQAKQFIERCLLPAASRPSAKELLNDPFLAPSVSATSTVRTNSCLIPCSVRDRVDGLLGVVKEVEFGDKKFKLLVKMKDAGIVRIELSVIYSVEGKEVDVKTEVDFSLETDNNIHQFVMKNIATKIKLSTEDVAVVTEFIDEVIKEVVYNQDFIPNKVLNARHWHGERSLSGDDNKTTKNERSSPRVWGRLMMPNRLRTFSF
ncbi:probable serine/threonine-protein kinase WNK10 [Spinacia oleracea]|uniref:non-specific serine/threonine protein kinase n=1 Tax=Spinacia oleracea TaxID=3562 RepID=A0A9R0JDD5_SPIOL|nr:probable serine/threonine-protein kinase WNK10 [Spinacia oleracea]